MSQDISIKICVNCTPTSLRICCKYSRKYFSTKTLYLFEITDTRYIIHGRIRYRGMFNKYFKIMDKNIYSFVLNQKELLQEFCIIAMDENYYRFTQKDIECESPFSRYIYMIGKI